jgi:hypothetical protein
MNALSRPLATLAAAAVGGAGLWLAGHWDSDTNGGYWAVLGVAALIGLLLGLSQLRAPDANAPGMLLLAWVPVTVAAGWVLVASQPESNTFRDHVVSWSSDIGIADVVDYVSPFVAVLALGIGLVFGFTLLTSWAARESGYTDTEVVRNERAEPVTATGRPAIVDEHVFAREGDADAAPAPQGERERQVLLVP